MMFVLPISVFSQTDWSTEGNAVIIGKNKLGTTNDMDVAFITNNQFRMWLTSNGLFGINTYPEAMLDINGSLRLRTSPIRYAVLTSDSIGNATWQSLELELLDSHKLTIKNQPNAGVSLNQYLDNTDEQQLSLSGSELSITSGNSISLLSFMDNTDQQMLTLSGTSLSITNGNSVDFINWDTNASDDFSGNYNDLLNLPELFDGSYFSLTNQPDLFDGDYNSLTNKPELFDGNFSSLTGVPTIESLNYWTKLNNNLYYNIGMVGVGISAPQKQMHIHNPNFAAIGGGGGTGPGNPNTRALQMNSESALLLTNKNSGSAATDGLLIRSTNNNAYLYLQEAGNLEILTKKPLRFKMESNGNVAIGTVQTNYFVVKETGKIGIKTNDPTSAFDINGDLRIRQGASENYVLTSNSDGTGQWKEMKLALNGNTLSLVNHNTEIDLGVLKQTLSISNQQLVLSNDGNSIPLNIINYWSKYGNKLYYTNTVGIGTTDPDQGSKLHIVGNEKAIFLQPNINSDNGNGYSDISFYNPVQNQTSWTIRSHVNDQDKGNALMFWSRTGAPLIVVGTGVKVGIGTPNPQYMLDVRGNAHFFEVRVRTESWSDFVFDDNYQLPDLQQLELFVKTNRHLPDVPSEAEVIENGVDLGEMNKVLLQKVEELTLIIIEQDKRLRKLEEEKSNNSGN
jgi:hypothetical protein